jgi:predicted N-acetyltransferase YhbS
MKFTIRPEIEADHLEVEELHREAFWNLYAPGCDEHYLCHILRDHIDFIKELDFVAEIDGKILGSIMYTKSQLLGENGEIVETVSFGPLCVHPKHQRKGIGTALIEKTKSIVQSKNIPAIIIYGDPHNYCKHGFKNGIDFNVSNLEGDYPLGLLILETMPGFFSSQRWKARQSAVFNFDSKDALEFDKKFKEKEKIVKYSQELFRMQIRAYLKNSS